jgi:hypothetical protein
MMDIRVDRLRFLMNLAPVIIDLLVVKVFMPTSLFSRFYYLWSKLTDSRNDSRSSNTLFYSFSRNLRDLRRRSDRFHRLLARGSSSTRYRRHWHTRGTSSGI